MSAKQVIGGPLVIGGRKLSLSRAIRAGDFVFLTGQVPFKDGQVMTTGTIEDQTRAVLEDIKRTLAEAGCALADVETPAMAIMPIRYRIMVHSLLNTDTKNLELRSTPVNNEVAAGLLFNLAR